MDTYPNQQNNTPPQFPSDLGKRSLSMEIASMILGLISILTCTCVYTSLICGALAILFALLSRGGEYTMSFRAKTGMWLGIIGLVIFAILIVITVLVVMSYGGIEGFLKAAYDMYGIDYRDLWMPVQP